jgi:carbon-monoxide dehydrogenase medium subunit
MPYSDFTLHRPRSAAEAIQLGEQYGASAAYLAGGTDLLVDLRSGRKSFAHLISLGAMTELREIALDDGVLRIGALAILADVAASDVVRNHLPALAETIESMAGPQIRNRATLGGNFCCGVPCSDTPPIVCAAGGELVLRGSAGERAVPARDFVLAPRVTVLQPGEILAEVRIPAQPAGTGAAVRRFALRRGSALAVASVSAWLRMEGGTIAEARVVMGAVGPVPLFADGCAQQLVGREPGIELFAAAGRTAAAEAQPISDLRGSEEFRRDIVEVLAARALAQAAVRASGGAR